MRQRKAIIYIRVSTDEQAEKGHSLQHQEERVRTYCAINGIDVVALYKEDHSAKTFERPEFKKLLDFLRRNKECADLLLFLKWDRFSRNAPEAYSMISKLRLLRIEPQAIEQPLDLNIPENKIMLALYLTTPEVENDRRSLNIIAGIRRALKDGHCTGQAPTGYANKRDENNKPIVVIDSNAPLVKHAFELLAIGQHHIEAVRKIVNGKGLKIGRNAFWHLVRNPFYMGKIAVPAYKDEEAVVVKGRHEPIISEAIFYDVQDVLAGRKKVGGMPSHFSKQKELPLRGILKCRKCGKTLTGSGSKGNGGLYHYYHCFNGCNERFKAPLANDLFYGLLEEISGNKKLIETIEYAMTDYHKNKNADQHIELTKLRKEIEVYRKRLDNAQTLMLDGQLDAGEYRNIKAKIEPEIERLIRCQARQSEKNPEEQEIMDFGIFFLNNMVKALPEADLEVRHNIIGSMFPEKVVFENNELRTNIEESVIMLLINIGKDLRVKKGKGSKNFDPSSHLVVPSGLFSNLFIEDLRKLVDVFQLLAAIDN